MSGVLSFTEINDQHVELLLARTVLSLFSAGGGGRGGNAAWAVSGGWSWP